MFHRLRSGSSLRPLLSPNLPSPSSPLLWWSPLLLARKRLLQLLLLLLPRQFRAAEALRLLTSPPISRRTTLSGKFTVLPIWFGATRWLLLPRNGPTTASGNTRRAPLGLMERTFLQVLAASLLALLLSCGRMKLPSIIPVTPSFLTSLRLSGRPRPKLDVRFRPAMACSEGPPPPSSTFANTTLLGMYSASLVQMFKSNCKPRRLSNSKPCDFS